MNLGFNTRGNSQTSGRTTQAILGLGCLRNTKGSLTRKFKYCNARDRNVVFQCVFNQPIPTLTQCPEKISAGGIFTNNDELKDLRGVTIITGNLRIEGFDGQPDFSVFDCLNSIEGYFIITGNSKLTSISGFPSLNSIKGDDGDGVGFDINNNPLLTNISGFLALNSITTSGFYIENNLKLVSIPEFSNLEIIKQDFGIRNNNLLENISGFTGLISIGSFFEIYNNSMLTSISGFTGLPLRTPKSGTAIVGPNKVSTTICYSTYTKLQGYYSTVNLVTTDIDTGC